MAQGHAHRWQDRQTSPVSTPPGSAVIGPNAIIRLAEVLREDLGPERARDIFRQAGWSGMFDDLPTEMVDERIAAALYRALFAALPEEVARAIASQAGLRTADYILAHRIPQIAKTVLRLLPERLAAPRLAGAIEKHAWTFAGSGAFSVATGPPLEFHIADNPLAMPGCVWHRAVFERLFRRLVSQRTRVRQTRCCHDGAASCQFQILIGADSHVD